MFLHKLSDGQDTQGDHHSEACPWLASSCVLQEKHGSLSLPSMLLPQDDGQEGAEEAENRGTLCRTLQETQLWNGEQNHATAA